MNKKQRQAVEKFYKDYVGFSKDPLGYYSDGDIQESYHFSVNRDKKQFTVAIIFRTNIISGAVEVESLLWDDTRGDFRILNSDELKLFDSLGFTLSENYANATKQKVEDWIYDE